VLPHFNEQRHYFISISTTDKYLPNEKKPALKSVQRPTRRLTRDLDL